MAAVLLIFATAFVLDTGTGNQWTALWGSGAILASIVLVFPALRTAVFLGLAYVAVWLLFNGVRAVADESPWATTRLGLVDRLESSLTGGRLPTMWLQGAAFDPDRLHWYDAAATLVYLSYFVVPHAVALILLFRNRAYLRHLLVAVGCLFLVSVLCFIALPINPPWRASEAVRIVPEVLTHTPAGAWLGPIDGSSAGYGFEPNPVASWPSVHLGVTVILAILAASAGRRWALSGAIYACLMGASLVYLGEHYLVDVAGGAVIAWLAWRASLTRVRPPHRASATAGAPSEPPAHRDGARRQRSGSIDGAPRTV